MLNVANYALMLNVDMLSVVMSVVMLSVVAPGMLSPGGRKWPLIYPNYK